ncbi:MAG: hypothetical protein ACFFHD_06855, partial [Promethearchaeota archaeon]
MIKTRKRGSKYIFAFIIIATLSFNIFINCYNLKSKNCACYDTKPKTQDIILDEYTEEWLDNRFFEIPIDPWYTTSEGDTTDLTASTSAEQANYEVNGENYTKEIILNSTTYSDWTPFNRTELVIEPNLGYGEGVDGVWCGHDWNEDSGGQPYNTPRMHWRYNVSMPFNMSDYIITSASFYAIINATVNQDVDTPGDALARWPSSNLNQWVIYDYAQFYVEVSDVEINELNTYRIAFNQTVTLGNENLLEYEIEGLIDPKTTQAIIDAINNVLAVDPGHDNFTIVLGIYMYCEDNYSGNDRDQWEDLRFKELNLTFTYAKKIDQSAALSWEQEGDELSGSNIDILNATLNFKYKIDKNWTDSSPNSEFRILINNRQHTETIKLSNANSTFQDAKPGGLDVSDLILKNVNITVSIQVYMADTFALDQKYIISIDNASLLISYTESIVEETTSYELFLNSFDKTLEKSIEVTMGDSVNITFVYKNETSNNFIENATVQLIVSGSPKNFSENDIFDYYNITINTFNLNLGNNYLTLTASKRYYVSIDFIINIEVLERETDLQLYLDKSNETLDRSISMIYGNSGNITITYKDKETFPYTHISSANVTLIGLGDPKDLSEDILLEQYYIIIDTKDLGLGITYLNVEASKENYTSQSIRFKIEVIARSSYIDKIYLNKTETNLIEIPWNEILNIAVTYNDTLTNAFIDGALVQLTGTGITKNFTENSPLNYSIDINTNILKLGVNFLTILAQKENYSLSTQIITITVLERETNLETFLNKIETNLIEIPWNENINIAVTYNDTLTNNFIDSALIQLKGTGISKNFTENSPFNYSTDINTNKLKLGVNFLTISAQKENYSLSSQIITVTVLERETNLEIYINNSLYLTSQFYNTSVGEFLNITVLYKDASSGLLISSASVQLIESGIPTNLTENLISNYYNITVETELLGAGVKFLTITANKDNYTFSSDVITLMINEKKTGIELFIDGIQYLDGATIEAEINDKLNVTIKYYDNITKTFLSGATVELIGKAELDENPALEYYNITISVFDLEKTLNRISIRAHAENYEFALIEFFIQVIERETEGELFLNNLNKTADPYLELPIGSLLNLTVKYTDGRTGEYIPGATIQLGGDLTEILNESTSLDQYYIIINTNQLSLGLNIFTIIAERPNFQPFIIQKIYINIRRINTNITTVSGETTISSKPGKNVRLEIILYDLDFGGNITGAIVTFRWQYGEGEFTDLDNDGIYEAVIEDVPVGSFVITIYAYLGDNYDFEPFEVVLSVIRPRQNNLLFLGLLIGTTIAAVILVSYIIYYRQVLRFPKPVRKVRKYRRTLKRKSKPSVKIIKRNTAFKSIYAAELGKSSRLLRLKPSTRKGTAKKEEEQKGVSPPIKEPSSSQKKVEPSSSQKKVEPSSS